MKHYKCLLCGRSKFTQKSPHRCIGGYRKQHLVWKEITENKCIRINNQTGMEKKEIKFSDDENEITVDGKVKYRKVEEPKELTLEDCVKDIFYRFTGAGFWNGVMPTIKMAEKHFLYGLLMCVSYKLNEGKESRWMISCTGKGLFAMQSALISNIHIEPLFASEELANRAIRIFENSQFDLRKLFQ